MKKLALVVTPLLALALALTGCGAKKDAAKESASDQVQGTQANKLTENQTDGALVAIKGAFGETTKIDSGVEVTVTPPENFIPSKDATNYTSELTANKFTVTIMNGSTEDLDSSAIVFSADSGVNTCMEITDSGNGLNGAPVEIVPAGKTLTFPYATGCVGKPGDDLVFKVWFSAAKVSIEGKLA